MIIQKAAVPCINQGHPGIALMLEQWEMFFFPPLQKTWSAIKSILIRFDTYLTHWLLSFKEFYADALKSIVKKANNVMSGFFFFFARLFFFCFSFHLSTVCFSPEICFSFHPSTFLTRNLLQLPHRSLFLW